MKINCCIEMPTMTRYKYEIKYGRLTLDRPVKAHIPCNYGYINNTLADDGDALDVFVISSDRIHPTSWVNAKVIGVFTCLDKGIKDDKVVAILEGDKVKSIKSELKYIKKYLETYKKDFKVLKFHGVDKAKKIITKAEEKDETYVE